MQQLQALTGVAKGLTRTSDTLFAYEDEEEINAALEAIENARDDPRMVNIQDAILEGIRAVTLQWSTDATTADVRNSFICLGSVDFNEFWSGDEQSDHCDHLSSLRCDIAQS